MAPDKVIQLVREYATEAHGAQKRKYTPELYIVHPIRVMEICALKTKDACVLSAALLHDVLEDTNITPSQMADFLSTIMEPQAASRTLKLVVELTDVYTKKEFPQFNRRRRKEMERRRIEATSADSRTIKYADIIDNCREIVTHDPDFARVFLHECRELLKRMAGGNLELYHEAKHLVEEKLAASRVRQ